MATTDLDDWPDKVHRLRASVAALAVHIDTLPQVEERVVACGAALKELEEQSVVFQAVRLDAVSELRTAGVSYDQIASATGLSKARVAQLSRAALER